MGGLRNLSRRRGTPQARRAVRGDEGCEVGPSPRSAPLLPLRLGIPARQTHDYQRHGTTTLFAALSLLDGKVIGECLPRHRSWESIRFLGTVDRETPASSPCT